MKSPLFILTTLLVLVVTLTLSLAVLVFLSFQPADPSELDQTVAIEPVDEKMLTLPDSDQGGPWPIGPYVKSNSPIRNVELTELPKDHRFLGLTVSEQSGLAIATFLDNSVRGKYDTYALIIDLAHGKVQTKWSVPDFAQPISINSSGTKVLFSSSNGAGREVLYVGQRESNDQDFELSHWQPLEKPGTKQSTYDKSIRLKWASFVGQRVVAVNEQGRMHVFDDVNGQILKWVSGVEGFPTLTPDQEKIVFVNKQNVLLFDPDELAITHALKVDEIPEHAILSVDPLANKLLIAGTGKAIVVRLDDLTCDHIRIDKLATKNQLTTPDLAWFGDSLFFYQDRLYDFDSPMPVWSFSFTDQLHLVGESLWGITKSGGIIKLQRFGLKAKSILGEIREAYRTSDVIPFRAGDSVQIDVSQLPAEHQTDAMTALQKSLEKAGYVVDKTAPVKAVATLGDSVDRDITYQHRGDSKTFDYRGQTANLVIEKDGQRLWGMAKTHFPPGFIPKSQLEDKTVVAKWGKPDYSVYSSEIPTFMRNSRSGHFLGHTDLGRLNSKKPQLLKAKKTISAGSSRTRTETRAKAKSSVGTFKEVLNPFVK